MKKCLVFLLGLLLLWATASAELVAEEDLVTPLDGSDTELHALPMDDYTVHGDAPAEENFTETGYSDPSIVVEAWHEWVDDAYVSAVHVKVADASQLRTALTENSIRRNHYVWVTGAKNNAVVAIGGEFLYSNPKTYTVRMGVTLRTRGYKSRDTLITDQNGDFHIFIGYSDKQREEIESQGYEIVNLFNFGPALVIDGELKYHEGDTWKYSVGYTKALQPRTAIGQIGPLEYLMVVVDGRNVRCPRGDGTIKLAKGLNVVTLGQYMLDHGCVQAYTLDGGGSAAMYYHNDIFSVPNSKRGVTDIVYFATLVSSEE